MFFCACGNAIVTVHFFLCDGNKWVLGRDCVLVFSDCLIGGTKAILYICVTRNEIGDTHKGV